ncbi:hypothetical protein Lser_V15G27165 [Lactuca serriola]
MQTEVGYRSWRSRSAEGGIAGRKGCVCDLFSFLVRSVSTQEGGQRTSVLCLCLLEKRNLVGSSHKGGSMVLVDRCFFFSGELCQQGNSSLPENAIVGLIVFDSMVRVYDLGFTECLRVVVLHGERKPSSSYVLKRLTLMWRRKKT